MGAMISIKHDVNIHSPELVQTLFEGLIQAVSVAIDSKDVFGFMESAAHSRAVDSIEVFVLVNDSKTPDPEAVVVRISEEFGAWKQANGVELKINLNVIPVKWHYKIGI